MIWLASFPRSGNTFFRNVLYEVYGLESSTFHRGLNRPVDKNFHTYPLVKTHLLPHQLPKAYSDAPAVYLVRDGRDSVVSLARHRSDIVEPGSDFTNNLLECILAKDGSHFGGWSQNVHHWTKKADIIIKFEDLIKDPIAETEKLRALMELPPPKKDRLPTFERLKKGNPKYGGRRSGKVDPNFSQNFFRKGKVGSHKDEMPSAVQDFFLKQHGLVMHQMGYIQKKPSFEARPLRLLIEGSKYFNPSQDGVSRYTSSLIEYLPQILKYDDQWEIDILHKNEVVPLVRAIGAKQNREEQYMSLEYDYEARLLKFKQLLKTVIPFPVYRILRKSYIQGPWRKWLRQLKGEVSQQRMDKVKKKLADEGKPYDIIHATVPQGLRQIFKLDGKKIVTIHDITHLKNPELHTRENVEETEEGMQLIPQSNANVICVSDYTKKDVLDHYPWTPEHVDVIHEGINPDVFNPKLRNREHFEELNKYNLPKGRFILCLSTLEPRKNLKRTIQAFLSMKEKYPELQSSLVIAGKKGWKLSDVLPEEKNLSSDIRFTGFIDEADLPLLYARAHVFCYASLSEGFGLPLLEAMSSGTPVIYGNNSAMAEIIQGCGMGVEATNTTAIARAMYELSTDSEKWHELSERGRYHSNQYTWMKMAFSTIQFYKKVARS